MTRCSDQFDANRERLIADQERAGKTAEQAANLAEMPHLLLNKALAALEEANTALQGVVQHIDFTRKVGQTALKDISLQKLIDHFNADREFTAGRAQNYLDPQHVEKIVAAYHEYADILVIEIRDGL